MKQNVRGRRFSVVGLLSVGMVLSVVALLLVQPGIDRWATIDFTSDYGYGSSTVPGAPTKVHATALSRGARVTWNAPVDDGGEPIVSYRVTARPGTASVTTGDRQATFGGLDPRRTYTFRVTAENAVGSGLPSAASNPVRPKR